MQVKLTIQERLKDLRVERGLTLEQLAEQTGLSKSALGKYEADDFKDISPFSIVTLAKFYGVSTDYLLGMTETKNHPDTDLDALHLSDDAIEVLKAGQFNHRLLSEMLCHKDFQRMMLDAEIYVDAQLLGSRWEQIIVLFLSSLRFSRSSKRTLISRSSVIVWSKKSSRMRSSTLEL